MGVATKMATILQRGEIDSLVCSYVVYYTIAYAPITPGGAGWGFAKIKQNSHPWGDF